jgi:hypothetical protein
VSVADCTTALDVILKQRSAIHSVVDNLALGLEVALEDKRLGETAAANPEVIANLPAFPVVDTELPVVADDVVPVNGGIGQPARTDFVRCAL